MLSTTQKNEINCPKMGHIKVYIRGNRSPNETIMLTVHDLGCNHEQYDHFIDSPCMDQITERVTYVHVELPGQGDNAPDLPASYEFPTFQEIAEDLSFIMDTLSLKTVILFGEGAGANILARLAMNEPRRVFGAILIHCAGSMSTMESMRDVGSFNITLWKVKSTKSNPVKNLVEHRFGVNAKKSSTHLPYVQHEIQSYKDALNTVRNSKNLTQYINAFTNRSNIIDKANLLICPMLLVTASLAVQRSAAHALHTALQKIARDDKKKRPTFEYVQLEDCANPLLEKPEKMAESIQFFLQGLGLVSSAISRKISEPDGSVDGRSSRGSRFSMFSMFSRTSRASLVSHTSFTSHTSHKSHKSHKSHHESHVSLVSVSASVNEISDLPHHADVEYEECGLNRIGAKTGSVNSPTGSQSSLAAMRITMEEADKHKSPHDVVFNPHRKYSTNIPTVFE